MTIVVAAASVLVTMVAFLVLVTLLHRVRTQHDTERSLRSYGAAFSAAAHACARSPQAGEHEAAASRIHVLVLERAGSPRG